MATSTSLKAVRRMISKMGEAQTRRLIEVMRADKLAQSKNADTLKNLEILDVMENNIDVVKANNECFTLKNLAINGHDLIGIGIKDGKLIGRTLNHLLDIVLAEPEKNVKEVLIKLALDYNVATNNG
jgi:tRNA nucleotidyltransferase (CCA-adding enzyme)